MPETEYCLQALGGQPSLTDLGSPSSVLLRCTAGTAGCALGEINDRERNMEKGGERGKRRYTKQSKEDGKRQY